MEGKDWDEFLLDFDPDSQDNATEPAFFGSPKNQQFFYSLAVAIRKN